MFVWRNKQRRDRRNFLTSGSEMWGAPKDSKNMTMEDELIRQEHEQKFVTTFVQRMRELIAAYLETKNGVIEINNVILEIDKINIENSRHKDPKAIVVHPEMKKRENIYEVFRKFDTDGSDTIDRDELVVLLGTLDISMNTEEFSMLLKRIVGPNNTSGEIEFDKFYQWFVEEAEGQQKKNKWNFFKSAASNLFYDKFKRLVMEVEARNLIVDKVVHDTGRDALIEFRTAHPPLIVCTDCNQCFSTMKELTIHQEDIEYHNEYNEKQRIVKSKFVAVDNAFLGVQGRKLTAHRLLFSPELNGFESRLRAVKESPYRPHIGDPGAHREEQLRRDMLVVGSDPRGGVRPLHSNFALHQQTRSSWYAEHNQLSLKDAITECNYIRDQWADVVTTDSTSSHVEVVFTWMHFVRLTILFKSECNNWKPEIMNPDPVTGKYQISKMLAPGRYRYKYVVDSVERIDPTKSVITENDGTESNYVVVINPKVNQEDPDEMRFDKCLSLRNSALYDGGVWALRNAVSTNSLIEELDLSFNNMSDEGILAVSDICSKLINLHVIKLNGNGFSFDGCRYLCNAFKSSKRIRHMELANNRIGDDGAEVIGGLIKHHTSLLSIILDANFIGDDGVDQLGLALISNRTLLKLSLADNRFRTRGAERLSFHLQSNGSLTELNVSSNPLGPEGVRHFGDLLGVTDSLKHLDISSTQMMLSHSLLALHAITTSIRTNKSLKVLNMKNNNIDSDAALEIAYALSSNRQIVQMDTSFNKIHLQWYQPDMYLKTKLMAKMPTIETSLCRNRAIERDPILSQKFCARPKYPVQPTDSYIGFWTDRRRWKNDKSPKIEYFTVNDAAEKVRITSEDEYVAAAVKKKTLEMEDFLCEENGQMLIRYVVKVINMYISLLRKDIRKKNKKSNGTSPFGSNSGLAGGVQLPKLGESESANYASDDMDDISITSTQQQGGENQFEMKASVAWIIPSHLAMLTGYLLEAVKLSNRQLESIDTPKIAPDKGIDNSVPVVDLTKGSHAEDDILLVVNIAQCETAFSMMGIILTEEYKTEILNTCLVNGSTEDINVKKLLKYYVANYSKLVLQGSLLQRVSGMAKVRLRKPTSIARQMIASSAIHTTRLEARKEFRSLKKNEPKFLCQYCGRRFESMKSLHSHEQKRNAHVKYHIVEDLWLSQIKVVYQAKYLITGLRFPAFYELCNVMLLPQNFSPQIFDDRGKLGRPVGVIEPNQGYRVEDIMGDWMQIRYAGGSAWTKYRFNNIVILKPSMSHVKHFWSNLLSFPTPVYFIVAETLPDIIEIKVRRMPTMDAEVCGCLTKGMVVMGGATLDQLWLQIVYNDVDAAWVLLRSGEITLLEELHPSLQRKMPNILRKSPCIVPPNQLVVTYADTIGDAVMQRNESLSLSRGAAEPQNL